MSHTPGPWLSDADEFRRICSVDFGAVAYVSEGPDGLYKAEELANARLIAAAPTMYDYINERATSGDDKAIAIIETIHALR